MWAQRLIAPSLFVECEAPTPGISDLGPGDVLVQMATGGVCGSDLPFFRGAISPDAPADRPAFGSPGFPMHELAGVVIASKHDDFERGDRVVGWASRFDAIAELVVTTGDGLYKYGSGWAPEAAIIMQPLACVIYAMKQVTRIAGLRVAVIGQGPIGLLFSHVAKSLGATHVTGVDMIDRTSLAVPFGVDSCVHAPSDRWAVSLGADRPAVVVEAVGHQTATLNHAVQAVAPGGEIYYFGIPDDVSYPFAMRAFLRKNLTLRSGVTLDRRRVLREADHYLQANPGLADGYVTHVLPATEAQTAFDLACRPAPNQAKVVITMV